MARFPPIAAKITTFDPECDMLNYFNTNEIPGAAHMRVFVLVGEIDKLN
ncbi:hypothetical protein KKB99_02605 [bacterium]|nr:hypothetical protein [bacterium]MBU1024878.1 hypothetical protein [bacterium]